MFNMMKSFYFAAYRIGKSTRKVWVIAGMGRRGEEDMKNEDLVDYYKEVKTQPCGLSMVLLYLLIPMMTWFLFAILYAFQPFFQVLKNVQCKDMGY